MRALLCGLLLACSSRLDGSHGTHSPDAAATIDAPAGGTSALGMLMPQELAGNATAVMATPTVVAITYDSDPNRADVESFYAQYAASPAWAMHVGEYGVGALTVGAPIHLAGTPAASDTAIRQLLATNLGGTSPAWGAPSESTLYSFTLPVGASYTDNSGTPRFCGGYHDDVLVGTVDVAYAIQLPCSFPPPITPVQALAFTLAHELVEGVTDPRWEHDYAWGAVDAPHAVWAYITDGELGDLCEFTDTFLWTDAPGMTFALQRIWSNAAARAGTDPCIGDPTTPYYQTVPDQPDDLTITLFGGSAATKGTKIAVGASGTITAHVAGSGGPFTVQAIDIASAFEMATTPSLVFQQPSGQFAVGDTVTIPVTVKAKDANLGAEAFELATKPVGGGPTTYFYGVVGQ